jgi:hypothetical protein
MKQIALGMVVTALISTSAWAEEPTTARLNLDGALAGVSFATAAPTQATPADESPFSVLVGADFPTAYFFRGIRQESDPSFTFQPFADLGIAASETVTINVGTWNSFHTGSISDAYGSFYESDFYASVAFALGKVTPKVLYTAYTSPEDVFGTVHELAFVIPFDDSESGLPLAPTVTLATELGDYGADGVGEGSTYLELAVTPAIPMSDDAPVSISIPVKLGLSLSDYYGEGGDTYGFFSGGVLVGVPVNDMFEVHGGVTIFGFGDALKSYNNDEASQVVASIGFSVSF